MSDEHLQAETPQSVSPADAEPNPYQLLDNQLCFPLYAASRLVTRAYQPLLAEHGLTYPQYIILMILWEDAPCSIGHLGRRAILETNTLSPLLKTMEKQGWLTRTRSRQDERVVEINLTDKGSSLKETCSCIPQDILDQTEVPLEEAVELREKLNDLLRYLKKAADLD